MKALDALLGALPEGVDPPDAASLEAALANARAAWPGVAIDDARLAVFLGARVTTRTGLPDLAAGDLLVACGCLAGDPAAIEAFESRYLDVVEQVVPRLRYQAVSADDLRQLLRVKLLCRDGERPPRLADYRGTGPLRAWVRVAATRTVLNRRRGDARHRAAAKEAADLAAATTRRDPQVALLLKRNRDAFRAALADGIAALAPLQRRMLRQHYLRGLTLVELASIYDLHRVSVARRMRAAREQVLQHTRESLARRHGLADSDIDSLLHHLGANGELALEVSLASTVSGADLQLSQAV